LQRLTRSLETSLVVGDALVDAVNSGAAGNAAAMASELQDRGDQTLRGRAEAVRIWTR
jgi:class 3 adenylate cyclase